MYRKIDLSDFPEVSIIDEEGKQIKGVKIEVGKRLSINNPYDFSFSIIVESHQNDSVKGEVANISLNKFENIAKKEIPPLSLSEKVELVHIDFAKR
jgi:hypothetical protein